MANGDAGGLQDMPDLEYVYSLIEGLYKSTDNDKKQLANEKLTEIQRSIFGWKIADQLLINGRDYESCYFAAQTLKYKTINNFKELPKESYPSLKDSLVSHILKMDDKVILNQLCISLAYIFFFFYDWNEPIEELARALPSEKFTQVLIFIGQDFNGSKTDNLIPFSRINQLKRILSHYFLDVYKLVKNHADLSNEEKMCDYFCCLEFWSSFAGKEHIDQMRELLANIFQCLKNVDISYKIHLAVSDCLTKIIFMVESNSTFPELLSEVNDGILLLEPYYDLAVRNEDTGKTVNFCNIFSELALSTLQYVLNDQVDTKILNLMAKCIDHHEYEIAEQTFNFWSEFAMRGAKNSQNQFKKYYFCLLNSLTKHSLIDEDLAPDSIIDNDDEDFFYRGQIEEIIEELISSCDWVEYMKENKVLENLRTTTEWTKFESQIFVITSILAEECSLHNQDKNQVLPGVVTIILGLLDNRNIHHAQVLATSCDLLAELRHWINENTEYLESIIQFLLTIIQRSFKTVPKLACRACKPLKLIFKRMEKFSDFESMKNLFGVLESCYIQTENMKSYLSVSLMSVMTAIISNPTFSNFDQQKDFVLRVIQLFLIKMNAIINTQNLDQVDQTEWEMIIDNIYAMFKGFVPNEITKKSTEIHALLQSHIWPFLSLSIRYFNTVKFQIIEHCSRCLRHIIRSMKPHYLLQPIIDQIVPLYQLNPKNSPLLYVGAVLVDEFATENDLNLAEGLIRMLNAFSATTFQFFSREKYQDYPDTIADYFNLCSKSLVNLTEFFLSNTETLNNILNLTLVAVDLVTTEAIETRSKFLINFMQTSHPIVDQYMHGDFGQRFVFTTFQSLLFVLPSYTIPDLIETVWTFKTTEPQRFAVNFRELVNQLLVKAETEGYTVNREFFEEFYNNIVNANNSKRVITQCRTMQKFFKAV